MLSPRSMATTGPTAGSALVYKILVMGDLGVGKTSIIRRAIHGAFPRIYKATIGVDFALLTYDNWENINRPVRLQMWDIAGQERFGNMTRVYYKEAVGAFVVFDVTRLSTFEAVQMWKADLDSKVLLHNGKPIPAVLLANKCDSANGFDFNQLDDYCQRHKFVAWFKCSAKDSTGIDRAVRTLTREIIAHDDMLKDSESGDESSSTALTAKAVQGATEEVSAPLRRNNLTETSGDKLEHYRQLLAQEKKEKREAMVTLEHHVTDLNLCREVITLLQSRCEYYQSLAEQFQGQLQDAIQLYQQSKSEVIECTQERLVTEKQLQRAQRVQQLLNERLVTMEDQVSKKRPSQPVDQSMLEQYSITPTHRITLDKKIRQGCYGSVYALWVNGDSCIGKRLLDILVGRDEEEPVEQADKDALYDKFVRECYRHSQMNHPNIAKFIGVIFGVDKYDLTLLMEQLETDLRKYLQKSKDIQLRDKVSILHDVSNGLLYLHQQFVVHRDLTATNILLTPSLQAKIADLGVTQIIDQSLSTTPGALAYVPPEALRDQSLHNKSLDIFSFGVVTLYTGTQEFPKFVYERVPEAVHQTGEGEVYKRRVWVERLNTQHSELGFLAKWCLHDNPAGRPTTECVNIIMRELHREYRVETDSGRTSDAH